MPNLCHNHAACLIRLARRAADDQADDHYPGRAVSEVRLGRGRRRGRAPTPVYRQSADRPDAAAGLELRRLRAVLQGQRRARLDARIAFGYSDD
jgi:hypothetical protein